MVSFYVAETIGYSNFHQVLKQHTESIDLIAKLHLQNTLMITELFLVIVKELVPIVVTTVHV